MAESGALRTYQVQLDPDIHQALKVAAAERHLTIKRLAQSVLAADPAVQRHLRAPEPVAAGAGTAEGEDA